MTSIKYCPRCGIDIENMNNESSTNVCSNCGLDFNERKKRIKELSSKKDSQEEIYADFFQRLAAYFIDSIIISSLTWVVVSLIHIPIIIADPIEFFTGIYYFWIAIFFNWIIGFFYCCLLEGYNEGQTMGKRILHIKTVDENTLKIADLDRYAITNIVKTSPLLLIDFFVGFLISDRDSNKTLRFFQHLSKTVVIQV